MSWEGIRGALRWLVLMLLVSIIALGGLALRLWSEKDGFIAAAVHRELSEVLPECLLEFGSMRFVDVTHLELTQLRLKCKSTHAPLVHIPRIVITIDGPMLEEHRRVQIREVMMQSPEVRLTRDEMGGWNWERFELRQPAGGASPTWTIKNATIQVGFESPAQGAVTAIHCQGIQASLKPESHRRYQLDATGVADSVGPIHLHGVVDGNTGELQLAGDATEMRLSDNLLVLAGRLSPVVEERLAELQTQSSHWKALAQPGEAIRTASTTSTPPGRLTNDAAQGSKLARADASVSFNLGRRSAASPWDYRVSTEFRNGFISDLLSPLPLHDLAGEIEVSSDRIRIGNLRAANGASTLCVDGVATRAGEDWATDFSIQATRLPLDDRVENLLPLLPAAAEKTWRLLSPSGTFDVDLSFKREPGRVAELSLREFQAHDCRIVCDYFRYPLSQITGRVVQTGPIYQLELQGLAARRPVQISGELDLTHVEPALSVRLSTSSFPIDHNIAAAFQRPDLHAIRETLEELQLSGVAEDVAAEVLISPRTQGRPVLRLSGRVKDGRLQYSGFPYEVTQLSGRLAYDPLERDALIIEDVQGQHRDARITGFGSFDMTDDLDVLAITLNVLRVPIDHDLQQACVAASPGFAAVWRDFELSGTVDVSEVRVGWRPGRDPLVELEGIQWKDGQFRAAACPFAWKNVAGALDWKDSRLGIHSLHGWHGETYLQIDGATPQSRAYVELDSSPDGRWRVHFPDVKVVQLIVDDEFQRSVPEELGATLRTLELKGPVDLKLGFDMKGRSTPGVSPTADWSLLTILRNNAVTAGLPLTNVVGRVQQRGVWDGRQLEIEGYLELEQATLQRMTLRRIRGPFLVKQNRVLLGTPTFAAVPPRHHEQNPYRNTQLQADLYGGSVGADVAVLLDAAQGWPYQLELNLSNVELAEWVADQRMNSSKLMGKVNGTVNARGLGAEELSTVGDGWVQVTPAALYELPVFAQMFSMLKFKPIGDAAFNYAYADFRIHDGLFDFSKIELFGDAISLAGRGYVGYAGSQKSAVNLNFLTKARSSIPLLDPLVKFVGDNWVYIQVVGTTSNPLPIFQPRIGPLEEAFRGFMQAVEAGQARSAPRQPPTPQR